MITCDNAIVFAALRGRVAALESPDVIEGEGFTQAKQMAEKIGMGEQLSRSDLLNLRTFFSRSHETPAERIAAGMLGGDLMREWLFKSDLPVRPLARLSDRLRALEDRIAERILGHMEAVFVAAVGRTALKVAKKVKQRACKGRDAVEWLDEQPETIVRAAITDVEEAAVLGAVEDLDALMRKVLEEAAEELAEILADELDAEFRAERLLTDPDKDAAVNVAMRSVSALVLARLGRSDTEAITTVPPNIARDVLHAAGGADSSTVGGIPKADTGRVLRNGVEARGDGFTTSDNVLNEIQATDPTKQVITARYWRHSGTADAVAAHEANDGKRDFDCDFSAGPPGGLRNCGCSWEQRLEVVE